MTDQQVSARHNGPFESIKQLNEDGFEFWFARDLQPLLDYAHWEGFRRVIDKAVEACSRSGQCSTDHFRQVRKMVSIGSGARRAIEDFELSRYACYLVVQNGDPSKPVIANGQTYFAIQTRRQELADTAPFGRLSEDERRLMLRGELVEHNKALTAAAKNAGVETGLDYAVFQDHGYKGLYGGLGAKEIHVAKGLKKSQKILDHMGSTELAANLFRATQTEEKLRRDNVRGKRQANQTHYEVGAKVRQTIQELGGTMPEKLPTPEKSIKQIEREQRRLQSEASKPAPEEC
ncbi:DNA damage-inducible protein D [Cupriavidus oxalaticus]|uniref:DNA damage-inducible protein D n=1 Tax=Cupriavidus oxalaticus TaxID=96344 RepID=A0A5P3VS20_9BURK|nr:DNA damage-inducible protein D [Cupriavidus oxalaticus]QEZ48343.1 DNA damage-inducible protein D [Cupriavidus oxalaticus]